MSINDRSNADRIPDFISSLTGENQDIKIQEILVWYPELAELYDYLKEEFWDSTSDILDGLTSRVWIENNKKTLPFYVEAEKEIISDKNFVFTTQRQLAYEIHTRVGKKMKQIDAGQIQKIRADLRDAA